ncbi:MAG: AbrB/MazE/SpoVT family DNA-binding domain-containing protein [Gammaproteobacteria bacterium]
MTTSTSKLTRKYQATIPGPVREKLHLHAGDVIVFEIENDTVVVPEGPGSRYDLCSSAGRDTGRMGI